MVLGIGLGKGEDSFSFKPLLIIFVVVFLLGAFVVQSTKPLAVYSFSETCDSSGPVIYPMEYYSECQRACAKFDNAHSHIECTSGVLHCVCRER
ncbi:MAG: hypothetical protein ACMXYF_00390 [Candidatus Woesearchaeota archaeon]